MQPRKRVAAPSDDRKAVALLLAEHGPLPGYEAAARLGWTPVRWSAIINQPDDWFELTGSGWVLTPVGQVEFAEAELATPM